MPRQRERRARRGNRDVDLLVAIILAEMFEEPRQRRAAPAPDRPEPTDSTPNEESPAACRERN